MWNFHRPLHLPKKNCKNQPPGLNGLGGGSDPPGWGLSEGQLTFHRKTMFVVLPSQTMSRTQINGLNTGHGKRSAELKIATWNTTILNRTNVC